jgi:hypothetical protein
MQVKEKMVITSLRPTPAEEVWKSQPLQTAPPYCLSSRGIGRQTADKRSKPFYIWDG